MRNACSLRSAAYANWPDQIRNKAPEYGLASKEYHVYLVPRKTTTCVNILEEGGVLGDIVLGELPMLFLPLEQDLLSLELEQSFEELYFVCSKCFVSTDNQERRSFKHFHLRTSTHGPPEYNWSLPATNWQRR